MSLDRFPHLVVRAWLSTGALAVAVGLQLCLAYRAAGHETLFVLLIWPAGALAAFLLVPAAATRGPVARPHPVAGLLSRASQTRIAISGVLLAVIAAELVPLNPWDGQWWWLAAMALPLVALLVLSGAGSRMLRSLPLRSLLPAFLLFGLALCVRLPLLTASPPFVSTDEASSGLYARLFDAGHTPLLSLGWYDLPMVSYAISGVGLHLLGDGVIGLRTMNALLGAVGVVLIYLTGKELFGEREGVLAGVLLAFLFAHAELSRDGMTAIQGPTGITLSVYLMVLWLRRGGALAGFLCGVSLGLDLALYWSARLAIMIVLILLFFLALRSWSLLASRRAEIGWSALGLTVAALPLVALYLTVPPAFTYLQNQISVFSGQPYPQSRLHALYGHAPLHVILAHQMARSISSLNTGGDRSPLFFGWSGSMLDVVTAALLPAALIFTLRHWRRWEYVLPLIWFGMVLLDSATSVDPPNYPRMAAILPAAALLVGLLLTAVTRALERGRVSRRPARAVLPLAIIAVAAANLFLIFDSYPASARRTSMEATLVGRFLAKAPGAGHTILLSDGALALTDPVPLFLAPGASGCTLPPGVALQTCHQFHAARLVIALPGRTHDLERIRKLQPGGRLIQIDAHGRSRILAYEIRASGATRFRR